MENKNLHCYSWNSKYIQHSQIIQAKLYILQSGILYEFQAEDLVYGEKIGIAACMFFKLNLQRQNSGGILAGGPEGPFANFQLG